MNSKQEQALFNQIDEDFKSYEELGLTFREAPIHTQVWNKIFSERKQSFIREDGCINRTAMRNFRRSRAFVADNPSAELNSLRPDNFLLGSKRREKALLRKCLKILEDYKLIDLLQKYPSPTVGNPYLFEYKGFIFTHRWFKHIYALGWMNWMLSSRLKKEFVALDIGSAYGIFQSLLYQEYPGCHQILVDLPEQLILARYFLGACFPEAKIATVAELSEQSSISRKFIEKYDFVLLPSSWYDKLEPRSTDLVTSFACLGELKREFFYYYVQAPVFKTAKYLFTINPITAKSFIFKDSDITILDYPIWEPQKKLHFGLSPAYFHPYGYPKQKFFMFYELRRFPPFFEYVGILSEESGNHN